MKVRLEHVFLYPVKTEKGLNNTQFVNLKSKPLRISTV